MTRFSYAPGALFALLAAGPLFVLLLLAGGALIDPVMGVTGWQVIPQALGISVIALPFGMAIGAVPILLGGYIMGQLGVARRATRHPLLWAAAGAAIGLFMSLAIFPTGWQSYVLFAATGTICAFIVRRGTRWFDSAPDHDTAL